ncbi:LysE family translocator [Pseudomonas cerasi]
MELSLLLVYVFSVFVLIITPGPVVAMLINTSLVAGPKRAMLTALGTNGASLVLVMVAALILTGTLSVSAPMLNLISLVGCFFIAWLSLQALKDSFNMNSTQEISYQASEKAHRSGLIAGFLVGISNPKDIIFFVSFFPQFINVTTSFQGSIVLLSIVWVVIDLSILMAYIFLMRQQFIIKFRKKITFGSSLTLLVISVGGMLYSGGALLAQGAIPLQSVIAIYKAI